MASPNHGKPTYKKDTQVNGLDVMLYFWDERDGKAFSGWWFGPKVGGDQVWAYHPRNIATPPKSGWKVPYDGPVDPTLAIAGGAGQAQQGQQQKGGPQQGWGAAQKGGPKGKGGKDQQSQQAEMARKRQEQASTLTIRRVITKLRSATPESIDEVKAELQTTLAKELGNCGAQTVKMQEEAEKGVQMATQRIEQLLAQKRELEAKKAAMELQRKEARETAEKLLKELEALGEQSETMIQEMKEKSEPLKEAAEMSMALVEKTAKAVEEMGNKAKEKVKSVADFLKENSQKMMVPPKEGAVDIAAGITKAFSKNSEHTREAEIAINFAKATLAKMARKATATKKMEAMSATFAKFNKAKDGLMSKGEVCKPSSSSFSRTASARRRPRRRRRRARPRPSAAAARTSWSPLPRPRACPRCSRAWTRMRRASSPKAAGQGRGGRDDRGSRRGREDQARKGGRHQGRRRGLRDRDR
ncbi:unnamed protein product [Prorocentrum cordatum]|uniref:Uncharacterized protein n=1 Tax=Prorocentrum cordatum TaxID=2364126 RepID=A0ABN9WCB1_9DINO|nr:unnamed protein product [Polarella glacialis]